MSSKGGIQKLKFWSWPVKKNWSLTHLMHFKHVLTSMGKGTRTHQQDRINMKLSITWKSFIQMGLLFLDIRSYKRNCINLSYKVFFCLKFCFAFVKRKYQYFSLKMKINVWVCAFFLSFFFFHRLRNMLLLILSQEKGKKNEKSEDTDMKNEISVIITVHQIGVWSPVHKMLSSFGKKKKNKLKNLCTVRNRVWIAKLSYLPHQRLTSSSNL